MSDREGRKEARQMEGPRWVEGEGERAWERERPRQRPRQRQRSREKFIDATPAACLLTFPS